MNDDRDPILDACLDEVLAGRRPPDLTARILQAFAARGAAATRSSVDNSLPLPGPPIGNGAQVAAPPVIAAASNGRLLDAAPTNGQPVVSLQTSTARPSRRSASNAVPAAILAASLLAVAALAGVAYLASQKPQFAKNNNKPAKAPERAVVKYGSTPNAKPIVKPRNDGLPPVKPLDQPQIVQTPSSSGNSSTQVVDNGSPPVKPVIPIPQLDYGEPSPDPEVISFVNAELAQSWVESGVKPAEPATDSEWCRRVFVRVLGRIPTVEELQAFVKDKAADKRERLVDRLQTDEDYVEEYARHWSLVWSNVLVGRTGGRGESLADREGLEQYLRTSLAKNKPYNQLVQELLTATGSAKPGTDGYNGAVNFLLDGASEDATLASARVGRVFLGQQLQCAQCHTHPTQEWSQEHFWAFNSFFRQMRAEKTADGARLVNVDFPGQGKGSTDGEVFYETPTGLLKTAFPRFIDGTELPHTGELAQVDRRAELARLIVASEQFPRALVNRMWSHFFGYGFTQPVDDMGPNVSPSQPEILDRMAREFAARGYDLTSVIRWVALSDPFGRSSKLGSLASKDMPEVGEVALFSRYYSRQMQAEEVYNSLVQAAQIRKSAASEAAVEQARVDWLAQFSRNMATDDAMEETHTGDLRQSLIMMNGELMKQAVSSQHAGLLQKVQAAEMKFDKKVEHLFLSALSREPTKREQQAAATILMNGSGNEATALEDIWWALLNSNEFILDH
jgi:hypothetical protein